MSVVILAQIAYMEENINVIRYPLLKGEKNNGPHHNTNNQQGRTVESLVKERRVYVEDNITITACEKIIKRYEEKFPKRRVVRWFRDEIARHDMEPGGVIVQP